MNITSELDMQLISLLFINYSDYDAGVKGDQDSWLLMDIKCNYNSDLESAPTAAITLMTNLNMQNYQTNAMEPDYKPPLIVYEEASNSNAE